MFLAPHSLVELLALREGMRVADFGAGRGAYSALLVERVGREGAVYALDSEGGALDSLSHLGMNPEIFFPLSADFNAHIPLRENLLDRGLLVNTLFAIDKKEIFLREIYRILKPRGSVVVSDWMDSFGGMGPAKERVVSAGDALRLFSAHGFLPGPLLPAGTHHWCFVAKKV